MRRNLENGPKCLHIDESQKKKRFDISKKAPDVKTHEKQVSSKMGDSAIFGKSAAMTKTNKYTENLSPSESKGDDYS